MSDVSNKSVSIYIDQTAACAALIKLQAQADSLNKKIQDLRDNGKDATAQLAKLETVKNKIQIVQDQLDKGLAPTLKQQKNLVSQLKAEFDNLSKSDPGYASKVALYQKENGILKEMQANISGVKKEHDLLNTSFEKIGEWIVEYVSIEKAIDVVKEFFTSSVEEAEKEEAALSKLQNILTNIGRTDLFEKIKKDAEDLSDEFKLFKADEVEEVFQKLITLGKLTENQINQLLPVIINFAAKERIDLSQATDIFTKALEGNTRGLKEYGINLTGASSVSERFNILMTQMKPRVEGAAAAFGETMQGQIKETQVSIDKIKEQIGDELEPLIKDFYVSIQEALQGLEISYKETTQLNQGLIQSAKDTFQILKDLATFNYSDAVTLIELRRTQKALEEQNLKNIKDITQAQNTANSVAKDASTKPLEEQKIILQQNLALYQSSAAAWNDIKARGQQSSEDGHRAAVQVVTDFKVVQSLIALINTEKDKRILGAGGDDTDINQYNSLFQEAQDFNKRLRDLQQQSEDANKSKNQKEIDDAKHKYDEIILAYKQLQQKLAGSGIKLQFDLSDIEKLEHNEIAGIISKQIQEALKQAQELFQQNANDEYIQTKQNTQESYDEKRRIINESFAQGKIDYTNYQAQLLQLDKGLNAQKLLDAQQYSANVKAAAADVVENNKTQAQKDADNQTAAYKKAQDEILKIDQANVLNAKTLADKKAALKKEYDDQIANELLTDADKEKLHAEYIAAIKKLDVDAAAGALNSIKATLDYAQQAVGVLDKFSQAQTANEQALLNKQLAGYTAQQSANQKLYTAKLISANELAARNAALSQKEEKLKDDLAKKEFDRQKKIQIAQAIIAGALGIVNVLAAKPGATDILSLGAFRALNIAITAATTAAEIAVIASQKYAGGGKVQHPGNGKINVSANIPVQPNGDDVLATVKRGEVILNEKQQAALGGPKIFQTIGVPGFSGGGYAPKYVSTPMKRFNYDAVTKSINVLKFASGGLVQSNTSANTDNSNVADAIAQSNMMLERSQQINVELMKTVQVLSSQIDKGIKTDFSLSGFKDAQDLQGRILKNATFK